MSKLFVIYFEFLHLRPVKVHHLTRQVAMDPYFKYIVKALARAQVRRMVQESLLRHSDPVHLSPLSECNRVPLAITSQFGLLTKIYQGISGLIE